jgi:predicted MFS family arabinose efflux permease
MSIIGASFSDKQRGSAIGTRVAFTTLIEAIATVLGGWVVQSASWRWVFFINVPVAVLMLLITFRYVPESRDNSASSHLDWKGAGLVTLGLGALVYGLITVGAAGFGNLVVGLSLGVGLVALLLFVLVEVHSPAPMLPLSLFRSPAFSATNLLTLLLYAGLNGVLYFLSFNLQQVQGYSPVAAGAALFPFTVLVFVLSRWTGGLVQRYRARPLLIGGSVVTALGFALFAVPNIGGSYWITYFPAIIVMSLGMAIVVAPLTTAVMSSVEQRHSGVASGVNNAVARAAGLLAIAVLGLLVAFVFNSMLTSHTALLHLSPAVQQALDAQRSRLAAAQAPSTTSPALDTPLQRAITESFVAGFRVTMLVCAGLALLGALAVALLVPPDHVRQSERSERRGDAGQRPGLDRRTTATADRHLPDGVPAEPPARPTHASHARATRDDQGVSSDHVRAIIHFLENVVW